jgi:hypothetical protein
VSTVEARQHDELARALLLFAALSAVLLALDWRMRTAGGRGIVALEWAGRADKADAVLRRWGRAGRQAALASLIIEYGYAVSFTTLLMAASRHFAPASLRTPITWLAVLAGALDGVQTTALLLVLGGRRGGWPRIARWSSFTKFGVIGLDLILLVAAARPCFGRGTASPLPPGLRA